MDDLIAVLKKINFTSAEKYLNNKFYINIISIQ